MMLVVSGTRRRRRMAISSDRDHLRPAPAEPDGDDQLGDVDRGEDRREDAEAAWLRAWECAPDDTSRLQTAAALAPLGMRLPELDSLSDEYNQAIERIRTIHEVMLRDDDMSLLRARATESRELTVLLAERLMTLGQTADAATVLEAGGARWKHPLMMRMAAARYESAGDYEKAYEVAKAGGRIVEIPITFRDRIRGESKMSPDIVTEALWLVTKWGIVDRAHELRRRFRER